MTPTMILRIHRYTNYSYCETEGVRYEDTLQQLWVGEPDDHGYAETEWRAVKVVEDKR
jgi:hypothetical protein